MAIRNMQLGNMRPGAGYELTDVVLLKGKHSQRSWSGQRRAGYLLQLVTLQPQHLDQEVSSQNQRSAVTASYRATVPE